MKPNRLDRIGRLETGADEVSLQRLVDQRQIVVDVYCYVRIHSVAVSATATAAWRTCWFDVCCKDLYSQTAQSLFILELIRMNFILD